MSIMVAHLLAPITPYVLILISITFGCTFVDVYIFIITCTLTSNTSSSFVFFCIAYASIDRYSTPSSSSNFSMFTTSINVAFGLACSLEFQQPLLHMHKNSTTYVSNLYISWIIVCKNCIFSLYVLTSSHFENDGECNNDLIANGWMFNIPTCFTLLNYSFASFVSLYLHFLFLSPFMFTLLWFLFPCYFSQFFNRTLRIHAFMNTKTLKTHIIFDNKQK